MKVFIARIKAKLNNPQELISLKEVAMLVKEIEYQDAVIIKLTRQVKRGY